MPGSHVKTTRSFLYTATQTAKQQTKPRSDRQTFTLPDGRTLGFAEYGCRDGYPLLWFHGFPASRLEARDLGAIARHRGIRILALDRPGFGLSTFQPCRRIGDWPDDVIAFAKYAQLDRFAVGGGSGGGPYALACALKLPKEMLSSVGVVAGAPPWEAGSHQMPWFSRLTSAAVNYAPTGFAYLSATFVGLARWITTTSPVTQRIDRWLASLQTKQRGLPVMDRTKEPVDQDVEGSLTVEEQRMRLLEMAFDGFAQGPWAFVQEAKLLSERDWGFKFEDISYPVLIWHGTKDYNAPFSMIQYMAKRLPHGVLKEYEGDTHFTIGKHLEEMLLELIPDEEIERMKAA